jgi:hypothetical protein
MTKPVPGEGQFFTLKPGAATPDITLSELGLTDRLGVLAIPLLMFGFGFRNSSSQPTTAAPAPTATPSALQLTSPVSSIPSRMLPHNRPESLCTPEPLLDDTYLLQPSAIRQPPIAPIQSPGMAAKLPRRPHPTESRLRRTHYHGDL